MNPCDFFTKDSVWTANFAQFISFSKLVRVQLINLNCVVVQLNNMGVDFWNAERVLIKSQLEFTVSVVYSVFIRSNYQTTQQCLSSKSSL